MLKDKLLEGQISPSRQLLEALEAHAVASLLATETNREYAKSVRQRAKEAETLIRDQVGEVRGLVGSWLPQVIPVVKILFGDLQGRTLGETSDYSPTAIPGVYGRTCLISVDEIFGPTVSIDLIAEDQLRV